MKISFEVAQHKLIYVFGAPNDAHKGFLKIGETTLTTKIPAKNLKPNCPELNRAAHARIRQYTRTAGVYFKLLHTELAVDKKGNSFSDHDVHRVLKKSGVEQGDIGREWFRLDLQTARRAIDAVKQCKKFLKNIKPKDLREEIILRPEQEAAVNRTVEYFKRGGKDFLWNAKMRFGKTLCALAVVRDMNFAKTIIITHRPVVNEGWFDDFDKIFGGNDNFRYGSKFKGIDLADLQASKKHFVYFASIQDLRGSDIVGGKVVKNHEVFKEKWDFVIVDEAHEGTKTALGDAVIKELVKKKSKFLALSGTPFNLLDDFDADNVYTWDYVMEQRAKADWDKKFPCDHNPYKELPRMNIYTYDLGELSEYFDAQDMSFNFREFFRTDNERFVHEDDVKSFLDLLTNESDNNYPFSRADFREMFKHTLWIVPGVKEGRALSNLLKSHKIFGENNGFKIVNVAGNGKSDDEPADALKKVQRAIKNYEYTITLSCGKLTAGVTVPEWSAVFMLAGGFKTSAASYMQTIFRVQNPCNKGGVSKQNCYVFDFAPDRALNVIAAAVKASTRAGQTTDDQRRALGDLLNFCPVIAVKGSEMKYFDTAAKLLQRIKRVQAERIVNKGFEDTYLYNDTLRELEDDDWKKFVALKKIVGVTKSAKTTSVVVITDTGLTGEQREGDGTSTTIRRPLTDAEKEAARKAAVKSNAIKILHGVSIRMPLLIYGANVPFDEKITIEKFVDIVDDASWEEFMPKGVTKDFFRPFIKYYDPENFINAGNIVRERAKKADDLPPTERIKKIAALFATFKNPDKETVLTPWDVVKLHIDSVFDESFFTPDKKILEINSKTGLYPLYVACKIYRARLGKVDEKKTPIAALKRWDKTVAENIFIICKTPMAETITRRTLLGYRQGKVNAKCFDDLISTLKTKPAQFVDDVTKYQSWGKEGGKMFFDAVVGNPPYQSTGSGDNKTFAAPIYHEFIKAAYDENLTKHASLIHPARFLFNAGATPGNFAGNFLQNKHVRVVRYEPDAKELFKTSDIEGGLVITEFDAIKTFEPIGTFIPFDELRSIHEKVVVNNDNFQPFSKKISGRTPYLFTKKFHEENPNAKLKLSDGHLCDISSNVFAVLPEIFSSEEPTDADYFRVLGRLKNDRAYCWIKKDFVRGRVEEYIGEWKIFLPKANGRTGTIGKEIAKLISTPVIGKPTDICTDTFLVVGTFETPQEAEACLKYIKSRFCRVLLGILKITQDNTAEKWAKVPLQNFKPKKTDDDIDWSKSIPEIDEQLYDKYDLTDAEREFIERHVKEMT